MSDNKIVCLVIASPAQPGVAIQQSYPMDRHVASLLAMTSDPATK
jgi:hypothetical protein